MADIGTHSPVYRFLRVLSPAHEAIYSRLEAAVLAYLRGPTDEEEQRGYLSAIPPLTRKALESVTLNEGHVTISFGSTFEERVGSLPSTAGQVFLRQLRAAVFEFGQVQRLTLEVMGNCTRFWHMLEGSCQRWIGPGRRLDR